jgi:Fe-S cluster biogenesis protein NfuA
LRLVQPSRTLRELIMDKTFDKTATLAAESAGRQDLIARAIADLRPILQRDGGDIELVTIDGDLVVIDLKGACTGCVLASVTVAGIRKRIVDLVGRPLRVVPLSATTIRRESAA